MIIMRPLSDKCLSRMAGKLVRFKCSRLLLDSVYQSGRYERRGGLYEAALSLGRSYLSDRVILDFCRDTLYES